MPAFEVGKPLPKHPRFDVEAQARDFWRRSDRASHQYPMGQDATGVDIIKRLPAESEEDHEWRRQIAVSPRHVKSIVSLFNAIVCRTKATRPTGEPSSEYTLLQDDPDGTKTPLPRLMQRALRKAQVEGCSYLLADTTESGSYETTAQMLGSKARPLIRRISADQVVWWRDWNGEVIEAVILMSDRDGRDFAWYVTEAICQKIWLKLEGKHFLVESIDEDRTHTYGACPLVRLAPDFGDEDDPGEDSQAAPIAEQQRVITAYRSLEAIEIHKSTFTMWAFMGASKADVEGAFAGPGKGVCLPPTCTGVTRMGSDPTQAQSIRDAIKDATSTMLLAAGLSPGNPMETGAPESGAAKAYKYNETESRMAAVAKAGQDAENRVRERALAGVKAKDYGDAKWPESFMAPDVEAMLDHLVQTLAAPLPQLIKAKETDLYAQTAYELTPEEKAELEKQIGEMGNQADEDQSNPFLAGGQKEIPPRGTPPKDEGAPLPSPAPPPVPGGTPPKPPRPGAAPLVEGLNGAQVTALAGIVKDVSLGQMPAAAASLLIASSFPSFPAEKVKEMIGAADDFIPEPPPEQKPATT